MKPLVFLDTETTSKTEGRLVQLAMKRARDGQTWNALYKPPVPITYEAMAVHHITEEMVEGCSPFARDVNGSKTAENFLEGSIMVAHNARFDAEILEREGVKVKEWIDTLKVARRLWPDWPEHKLQYLRYRLGVKVKAGKAHDALADVLVLEAVFAEILRTALNVEMSPLERKDWGEDKATDIIIDRMMKWSREASLLHTFSFGKYKGMEWSAVAKTDRKYLEWILSQDFDEDVKHTAGHWLNATMPKRVASPQTSML